MITPWKIHVFDKDLKPLVNYLGRLSDLDLRQYISPISDRSIIILYVDESEKTLVKLKFDIIEDGAIEAIADH